MKKTISEFVFERDGQSVWLKVFYEKKFIDIEPYGDVGHAFVFRGNQLNGLGHDKWGVTIDLLKEAWEFGMKELREDAAPEVEYEETPVGLMPVQAANGGTWKTI